MCGASYKGTGRKIPGSGDDGRHNGKVDNSDGRSQRNRGSGRSPGRDEPEQKPPAPATKQALVISLLRRGEGASIAELVDATGWLPCRCGGRRALWALEDDHLRRRASPPSYRRALRDRWPHERRSFSRRCRAVPRVNAGPRDIVVMDNLPAHKVKGIAEAITARGAELLYLPPYSSDLNPIEQMFAKLKALLRKAAARSVDKLWDNHRPAPRRLQSSRMRQLPQK